MTELTSCWLEVMSGLSGLQFVFFHLLKDRDAWKRRQIWHMRYWKICKRKKKNDQLHYWRCISFTNCRFFVAVHLEVFFVNFENNSYTFDGYVVKTFASQPHLCGFGPPWKTFWLKVFCCSLQVSEKSGQCKHTRHTSYTHTYITHTRHTHTSHFIHTNVTHTHTHTNVTHTHMYVLV